MDAVLPGVLPRDSTRYCSVLFAYFCAEGMS